MKAYIAIKFYQDARNREKIEKISQILENQGVSSFCMIRDREKWGKIKYSPKKLMQMAFKAIDACDFVLVELTEKGYGTGIEAGYAHAKGKPIITIAEKGSDISATLRGISAKVIEYKDIKELEKLLAPVLV